MSNTLRQSTVRALRDGETPLEILQPTPNLLSDLDEINDDNLEEACRRINEVIEKINNDSVSPQEVANAQASVDALMEKIITHMPKTKSVWKKVLDAFYRTEWLTKEQKLRSAEYRRDLLEGAIDALVERAAAEVNPDFKRLVEERDAIGAHLEGAEAMNDHIADVLSRADSARLLETYDLFSKGRGMSLASMLAKRDLMADVDSLKSEYESFMKTHAAFQQKPVTPVTKNGSVFGKKSDVVANLADQSGMMSLFELEKIHQIGGFLKQMQQQVNTVRKLIQNNFDAAEAKVSSATLKIRQNLEI